MKRLPGVTDVQVSLKAATTTIVLGETNTITLDQLRDIIRKNGFKPGESQIRATGKVIEDQGRVAVDLAPAKATLILSNPSNEADARRMLGSTVEVSGGVSEGHSLALKQITRLR
jgi:hypothetical protein